MKLGTEKVNALLESKNLVWNDLAYVSNHKPLNCTCKICGNICNPRYSDLARGQNGCKKCSDFFGSLKRKRSICIIEKILEEKNLKWDDHVYINNKKPLNCICNKCGTRCFPCYNSLQRGQGGCKECAKQNRKQTCLKIYGVDNPTKNKEIAQKASLSCTNSGILYHWKTGEKLIWNAGFERSFIEDFNRRQEDFQWQISISMFSGKIYFIDAYLPQRDLWVEIKGKWWKQRNKDKWDWFHKTYPNSELWNKEKLKELGILKKARKNNEL